MLTGAGESFSAGMDLKEFFRETDPLSPPEREQIIRTNAQWQWRQLMFYPKPTIAMVNGWCFGGAFTPLVSCDLAIAAEEAQVRPVRDQLGNHPGRRRHQGVGAGGEPARLHSITS